MRFNYDNPNIILTMVPHAACGQFISNCISISQNMIPVGSDAMIERLLTQGPDQKYKFDFMMGNLPSGEGSWHSRFYHSSSWYTPCPWARHTMDVDDGANGYFVFGLEDGMARRYMDGYWRYPAIKVSNSQYGIVLPGHELRDLNGWQTVFPNAKVVSVDNYQRLQKIFIQYKTKNGNTEIVSYYENNRDAYNPMGFVIDLDRFILSESFFCTTMNMLYDHLGFIDFHQSWPLLRTYWQSYNKANKRFVEE